MTSRIVLVTTNLAAGGAEAQVAQLAMGLRKRNWDVSVISLLKPTAFEPELNAAGVPVFSLDMTAGVWNPLGYARFVAVLRKIRPQIAHGHMFHGNLMARLARLVCPIPIVISTLHSAAESARRSANVRSRDRLYRLTDPLSDVTVAVSQAVGQRHVSAGAVSSKRLRVIPNGVDSARFRPDETRRVATRRLLGLQQEFVWLAAGRLMWKKGHPTLLTAFREVRGGVLLIAGAGPDEAELKRLAAESGGDVRFLGHRQDVAELMCAADAFVQASVVEGMPVALLEAAASGLPCVATDAGGTAEIVRHETTGYLVPPDNPEALAAAMFGILSLPAEQRQAMGCAARDHVVERYDATLVLSEWEKLYEELLAPWT